MACKLCFCLFLFHFLTISAFHPFFFKTKGVYVGSTAYISKSCNIASSHTRLNLSPFWGLDNPLSQIHVGASIMHNCRLHTPVQPPNQLSIAWQRVSRHLCLTLSHSVSLCLHLSPGYCVVTENRFSFFLCLQALSLSQINYCQLKMVLCKELAKTFEELCQRKCYLILTTWDFYSYRVKPR